MDPKLMYDALGEILEDLPDEGVTGAHKRILERARELNGAWERKDAREFWYSIPTLEGASSAYDRVVADLFSGYLYKPEKQSDCPHEERLVLESDDGSIIRLVCKFCGKMMECDHEHTGRVMKFNGGSPVNICELCRVIVGPA